MPTFKTPYSSSLLVSTPTPHPRGSRSPTPNAVNSSRKRPHSDYFSPRISTSNNSSTTFSARPRHSEQHLKPSPIPLESPAPLANSTYRLQHGLDTPGLASRDAEPTPFADQDPLFRRQLASPTPTLQDSYIAPPHPSALSHERNGAPRTRSMGSGISHHDYSNNTETWSNFAWRLASGTANLVWNFCAGNDFTGFRAGGGQAYGLTDRGPTALDHDYEERRTTTIPGDWPADDGYVTIEKSDVLAERPAKRRQLTQEEWVMVNGQPQRPPLQFHGPLFPPRSASPAVGSGQRERQGSRSYLPRPSGSRRNSRASVAGSRSNSVSYVRDVSSGSPAPRSAPHASTASMRSPHASPTHHNKAKTSLQRPVSRTEIVRASSALGRFSTPKQQHPSTSPPKQKAPPQDPYDINNPISFSPPYRLSASATGHNRTPSSAEAIAKYRRRRDREEKKSDESYQWMKMQLDELIMQGRTALERPVGLDDGDDGGEDGEDGEFSGDSGVEMGFDDDHHREGLRKAGGMEYGHARGTSSARLGRWAI